MKTKLGLTVFLVLALLAHSQEPSNSDLAQRAAQGDAEAQWQHGMSLLKSKEPAEKNGEAVKWLRASAEQGSVEGMRQLGTIYLYGAGVRKNTTEGVRWLAAASEKGSFKATGLLGIVTFQGMEEIKKDRERGFQLLEKASDLGDLTAMRIVAAIYLVGERNIAKKDINKGVALMQRAAEAGDGKAQSEAGRWFVTGEFGVTKNTTAAIKWLKPRAEAQDARAAEMYGLALLATGDVKEACAWFLLSDTLGNKPTAMNNFTDVMVKTYKDKKARETARDEVRARYGEIVEEMNRKAR